MPSGLVQSLLAHGGADAAADAWLLPQSGRAGRGHWRTAFSSHGEGGDVHKEAAKAEAAKLEHEAKEASEGHFLTFVAQDGREARLKAGSVSECKASCKEAPELKDEAAADEGRGAALMNAISGGEKNILLQCEHFCEDEAPWLKCFSGDASVVVQHKGRIPMSRLRIGDKVMVGVPATTSSGAAWTVAFESVLAWLHYQPDSESEMIEIRHSGGTLHLSEDHMVFAAGGGASASALAPRPAGEVRVGDRVLAPWLDGGAASPEVLGVRRVRKRGLFAPLLDGGNLFVCGTLASCYAIPAHLRSSVMGRLVAGAADGALHDAAHAALLPLRLACRGAAALLPPPPAGGEGEAKQRLEKVHPYAWVNYVLFAALLA